MSGFADKVITKNKLYVGPKPVVLPSSEMVAQAQLFTTREAEDLIRFAFCAKLASIPGPSVKLVNKLDRSSPPLSFEFVSDYILRDGVTRADKATVIGCQCRSDSGRGIDCEHINKCECFEYLPKPRRFPYISSGTKNGCLSPLHLRTRDAVFECNENCHCGPGCRSRVVQKGRRVPLEIFKTADRGWGTSLFIRLLPRK